MDDTVIDCEMALREAVALLPKDDSSIDILNRQEIITQLKELLITLSDSKASCTFALNGKWGIGKTFVLRMLEQQLQDYEAGDKFIVFHYNCWEYDYYDEPIVAIVSSMLNSVDDQTHLLSQESRERLQTGFEMARNVLQKVVSSIIENKIGLEAGSLTELMEEAVKDEKSENAHDYDHYYTFNRVMSEAKNELSKISESQTLVIVVDELDRCLPQYAIKVLERLHHLFSGISNTIVILGIDANQLDKTIAQIFGSETDSKTYLDKFISFEITLDRGSVNAEFIKKYCDYFQLFHERMQTSTFPVEDYLAALFSGIDIRTQEHLMERIKMVHGLLFQQEKQDFSFMCFELMLLILTQSDLEIKPFSLNRNGNLVTHDDIPRELANFLDQNWNSHGVSLTEKNMLLFNQHADVLELMAWYAQEIYGCNGQPPCQLPEDILRHIEEEGYVHKLKQVKKLLETIR